MSCHTIEFTSQKAVFARIYREDGDEPTTAEWLLSIGGRQERYVIGIGPTKTVQRDGLTIEPGYFCHNSANGPQAGWRLYKEDEHGEEHEVCQIPTRLDARLAFRLLKFKTKEGFGSFEGGND